MPLRLPVWCERHWQPYFEGRANGLRATQLLTAAYFNSLNAICPDEASFGKHVESLVATKTPICCLLEEQDHDELVINAGPADPDRGEDPAFDRITVEPRYQATNDNRQNP